MALYLMNDRKLLMNKVKSYVKKYDSIPESLIEYAETLDIFELQSYLISLSNSVDKCSLLPNIERNVMGDAVVTFYNKATLIVNKFTKKMLDIAKKEEKTKQSKFDELDEDDIFSNVDL